MQKKNFVLFGVSASLCISLVLTNHSRHCSLLFEDDHVAYTIYKCQIAVPEMARPYLLVQRESNLTRDVQEGVLCQCKISL